MIITLDWDKMKLKQARQKIKLLIKLDWIISIDLYRSPNRKGFHVYIYTDIKKILRIVEITIRRSLKDDHKRLQMDIDFNRTSVLFDTKIINGIEHHSKFIKTWTKK